LFFFFQCSRVLLDQHSFPTRRSSDLAEGAAHGYLVVHDGSGESIGHGEVLQTVRRNLVESRLVFHFKDGSRFDEKTTKWNTSRRSEEHTSELQSRGHVVCRLLLEKKN